MADPQPPGLLDQARRKIRVKHYSIRTEDTCVGWSRRFILFNRKRYRREMGDREISAFPTHLAVRGNSLRANFAVINFYTAHQRR
jgi:hypothetical protein